MWSSDKIKPGGGKISLLPVQIKEHNHLERCVLRSSNKTKSAGGKIPLLPILFYNDQITRDTMALGSMTLKVKDSAMKRRTLPSIVDS